MHIQVGNPRPCADAILLDVGLGEEQQQFGQVPIAHVDGHWVPRAWNFDTSSIELTTELLSEIFARVRQFASVHDQRLLSLLAGDTAPVQR